MPEMFTTDVLPSAQFKMMTGVLKAAVGDDGQKRVSGIASSTTKDLHGDTMTEKAIMAMERQANDNLTIFLNHKYDVPEDVFGSVESATAVQRGMDGEGNPNWDLLMTIIVNDDNPRAEKSFNHIQKGTKLGLSIGAMIPEGGAEREKETGALIINDLLLLETSVVSIPANPRSWIQNAVKALRQAEQSPATIEVPIKATVTVEETKAEEVCEGCGGSKRKPKDGCESAFHKSADEEVEAAEKAADVSDPEEAPKSEPAEDDDQQAEKAAEPEEDDTDGIAVAMAHVQSVDKVVEAVTAKLAAMTEKLASEKRDREAAERERDEAVRAANEVVAQVGSIMERVGQTPVGRKTHFVEAKKDFDNLAGVYSEPFRKMLSQGERK